MFLLGVFTEGLNNLWELWCTALNSSTLKKIFALLELSWSAIMKADPPPKSYTTYSMSVLYVHPLFKTFCSFIHKFKSYIIIDISVVYCFVFPQSQGRGESELLQSTCVYTRALLASLAAKTAAGGLPALPSTCEIFYAVWVPWVHLVRHWNES